MTDSVQQVWVTPLTLGDHAPLPALTKDGLVAVYDRREQKFGGFRNDYLLPLYATFDECRLAMIQELTMYLASTRQAARDIAATIEHVKTIPSTPFPSDAIRQGDRQEEAVQEEASAEAAEEVKPATELKRPRRR
jgi:hypothetical protein